VARGGTEGDAPVGRRWRRAGGAVAADQQPLPQLLLLARPVPLRHLQAGPTDAPPALIDRWSSFFDVQLHARRLFIGEKQPSLVFACLSDAPAGLVAIINMSQVASGVWSDINN